ncbi:MAG TPA: hypothetical protein VKQ36_00725 [Ktedonobacterales bacterium]|nr:hypothetical protein [Ktedonobacterales bacterium]
MGIMGIMRVLRSSRKAAASAFVCLGVFAMALLAGCSSTAGSSTPPGSGSVSNATATATTGSGNGATATPHGGGNANPQSCQDIAGFGNAGPVPEGGRLSNVPFPSNAQSTEGVDVVNSTGLYEVLKFDVCAPNTTTSALHSYYASQFPGMGWAQSSTYPYDGGYQAACGDPYCWKVGSQPEFSSLENVQAAGNGFVTYRMRLAFPPTVPDCSNILPPGNPLTYHFFWDGEQSTVPLPPLTVEGLGDGHNVGSKSVFSQFMCSPGTAASISSYMSTELSHHGWSNTSQNLCGTTGWMINNAGLAIDWQVSSATDWELNYCQ